MSEPHGPPRGEAWASRMAGSTGLEPAASGVTGRRYNRLNYDPARTVLTDVFLVGETGIEPVTSSL